MSDHLGERAGSHDPGPLRTDEPPTRVRRSPGPRSRARRRRRRRAAIRSGAVVVLIAVATVGTIWLLAGLADDDGEPSDTRTAGPAVGSDVQPTIVLATFDETAPNDGASLVAVLAVSRGGGPATLLLVPTATVADAPGHGLSTVGEAFAFGQGPLLDATLDNLLGVDLDQPVAVSTQGWATVFTRLGGLTVDLPDRLRVATEDGGAQVRFEPGEQFLDGPRVAELLTISQPGEVELAALPRAQRVLEGMLASIAAEPARLDELFADGATMLDTGDPAFVRTVLELAAEAHAAGELVTLTLPVENVGTGDVVRYRPDESRVADLVAERLAASVPDRAGSTATRLQILNGNGQPGVGQAVAERLLPAGYTVVLTGNADRFDHETTRVIVYDDDPASVTAGRQIVDLLGVGAIEISGVPQDVVDITIVVGHDFGAPDG